MRRWIDTNPDQRADPDEHQRPILCALALLAGLAWQPTALAQQPSAPAAGAPASAAAAHLPRRRCPGPTSTAPRAPTPASAATTTRAATYSAAAIFKSKHGHRGDKRSPFGANGLQCEACHGPGALHARNKKGAAINNFKADSKVSLEDAQPDLPDLPRGHMRAPAGTPARTSATRSPAPTATRSTRARVTRCWPRPPRRRCAWPATRTSGRTS